MAPIPNVDISSAAFKANPYPFYAQLRAQAPIHRITLGDKRTAWLVSRYEDVASVLKDDRFAKDKRNVMSREQLAREPWIPKMLQPLERNMLDVDAPAHTRLRSLVHMAFTPRLIETMRERIQGLTDELIDQAQARGRMDLIRDYALPLPTTIIAEMLGVPIADRHKFHGWSNTIVSIVPSRWGLLKAIPALTLFLRYVRRLVRIRRADPKDDLVSALVSAHEAGDQLGEDELLGMISLLLVAGHETTVNLIGNGMLALMEHPQAMDWLRDNPGQIKPAVEELLRYDGPLQSATERYARDDTKFDGVTVPRGEMVFALVASANRDDRQFEQPDTLDLSREPNRHVAFGQGVHFCLGAPLARLEGQIAINTLLRRLSDLKPALPREALRWTPGLVLRGLKSLPITFSRRRAPVICQP
jgi:cytochrome P450 PksS